MLNPDISNPVLIDFGSCYDHEANIPFNSISGTHDFSGLFLHNLTNGSIYDDITSLYFNCFTWATGEKFPWQNDNQLLKTPNYYIEERVRFLNRGYEPFQNSSINVKSKEILEVIHDAVINKESDYMAIKNKISQVYFYNSLVLSLSKDFKNLSLDREVIFDDNYLRNIPSDNFALLCSFQGNYN
uniref:SGNH/GDSL hydrolase family protein n=1 Tax=Strongyloides papillosus TaxID=174720 RepID=A0A0N5BIN2_STREA